MTESAQLVVENEEVQLPVYRGALGAKVIDVRSIAERGLLTFDPGFVATAACESAITYIDGTRGQLLYRGYPIEQLAQHSDYLETGYLLLCGELPTGQQLQAFRQQVYDQAHLDKQFESFFSGFAADAHPMAMLSASVAALAAHSHGMPVQDAGSREQAAIQLLAQVPILAAMCYKHRLGEAFVPFDPELGYAENLLHMMFDRAGDPSRRRELLGKALERIFLLHADHEQNASTSTVRLAGSTATPPQAAVAAGIAALWGPAHGGANEAVLRMLAEIDKASRVDEFVAKARDPQDPFRLMGFGHRVYKSFDPRAQVLKTTCQEVLAALAIDDPLLEVARCLELRAREDDYFIEKNLYPNVDFYSGILLKAMGIPVEMFTVIFAVGRTIGWVAHWHEMLSQGCRIGRPRQLYTGHKARDFVTIVKR